MTNPQRSGTHWKIALGVVLFACLISIVGLSGCNDQQPVTSQNEAAKTTSEFEIHWPPRDLDRALLETDPPLLNGELSVFASELSNPDAFRLQITLRRPEGETDRVRWNKNLAFPEHSWMAKVRVWDRDEQWLWPNLPYLLRAHGEERVKRYGGVDPGKGVDNDFAAILIRTLKEPLSQPLVSAEWYGKGANIVDGQSIVHTARSDEFTIRLDDTNREARSGRLGIWLIYADFLGASVPKAWPKKPEYAGGILAYFELNWQRSVQGGLKFKIEHLKPPSDTGFDWAGWSTGSSRLKSNLELLLP